MSRTSIRPLKIETAKRAEDAALSSDPRISNSEGASFDNHVGRHIFANSRGFAGEYRSSYCSLSTSPVARDGESMERDYWYTMARGFAGLEAAGARRPHGGRSAPCGGSTRSKWTPRRCRWSSSRAPRAVLLDNIFEAVHGMSIYRQESFLAGKLGEKVASDDVTVIDDGTMPGLFGTSPFDDEGVPSRRTVVIERGVLKSYLMNTYAARKLGMKTTGNASRGLTGNAGIGHGNFFLEKGVQTPEQIIAGISNGFYVTELMGFGVNVVTGRLFAGRGGTVDPQWRAGVRGQSK